MMFLRSIASKIHKHKHFAAFCSLENAQSSLLKPVKDNPLDKNNDSYVISYLVNRCGLSPEMAAHASKRIRFDTPEKPNAVLDFLSKQGFTKSQITELVNRKPGLLLSKPGKTLLPKIEFFSLQKGPPDLETLTILSRYPDLLCRSLEKKMVPIYNYLNDILGAKKLRTLIKRGAWIFSFDLENKVIPNVEFLKGLGVPMSRLQFILSHQPEMFGLKPEKFKEIVDEVRGMGFDVKKTTFVLAMYVRSRKGHDAVWNKCYETYSKWGWSEDDIRTAFRKHPYCMLLSEKKISSVLDFFVNELGRDSTSVVRLPYVLFFNLEKRIIPRCSVVQLLCSKGLVKKDWSLSWVLCPSESRFLEKFVKRHVEELPELIELYKWKVGVVEA